MTASQTPYELVGGDTGVRALVDQFYDLMDHAPEAAEIRAMHARSLKQSREKLFMFLSGWLGGPQLYMAQYGHPRLRARHLPFPIGSHARDQWLWCMDRALSEHAMPDPLRAALRQKLHDLADHMRNQPDPVAASTRLPIV